jgi:thiosulfate reductase cytochrome b subunit
VLFALLGGEIAKLIYVLIEAKCYAEIGGGSFGWLALLSAFSLHPTVLTDGLSIAAGFVVHIGFGWGFLGTLLTYALVDISTLLIGLTAVRLFLLNLSSDNDKQQNE